MAGAAEQPVEDLERPLLVEEWVCRTLLLGCLFAGRGDGCGSDTSSCARQQQARTTLWQTLVNFLNIFVGTGLQSMPYALAKGGWAALAVLAAIIPVFALAGQLICKAFDLMPAGAPQTYPELGSAAAGRAGRRAVMLFSFLELFGGSVILVMVCWQMLELLLPPGLGPLSAMQLAALVSTLLQVPLLFVDLKRLSRLSVVGLTSSALVVLMTLSLLVLDPSRQAMPQQPPPGHHLLSAGLIQSVGVFALSSTAHSTLPALRTAMRQPARFPLALALGFLLMGLAYASLAAAGYWYFGDAVSPLVASSLADDSFFTGVRLPLHRILAAMVLVNSLTKTPGLLLVLVDMILSLFPRLTNMHPPVATRALRLGLFAGGSLLALTAYDVLGAALSLLGGLASMSCSLLLPTAFYALLAWRHAGWASRAGLAALLAAGGALVLSITASNVCELVEQCRVRRHHGGGGGGLMLPLPLPWAPQP